MQRECRFEGCVGFRIGWREGHKMNNVVDDATDRGREPVNQPVGAGRDGFEHRLHVRGRASNDFQYLCRGRLPLQGILELPVKPRRLGLLRYG
jgi:hypothetical protein